MFWIGKYVGTHRARHFFAEIMKQRFDIHVVLRKKRVKQGFRGTQLETMKSCDFLFLALLESWLYYDNLLACLSQWWNVNCFKSFCHFVLDTDSWECDPEALRLSLSIRCHSNTHQNKLLLLQSTWFNFFFVWTLIVCMFGRPQWSKTDRFKQSKLAVGPQLSDRRWTFSEISFSFWTNRYSYTEWRFRSL